MPDRKKLQTRVCALLATLFFLAGCANPTGTSTDINPGQPDDISPPETLIGETLSTTIAAERNAVAGASLSAEEYIALPGLFSDKVEKILLAGDMVFVRSGAAIWHLDAQGTPKQTLSLTRDTVSVKAVSMPGGYGILEQKILDDGDDWEDQVVVHLLDSDLALKKQIDLNALLDEQFPFVYIASVALSPDGNRIAFASDDGVQLLDVGSGKATRLYVFPADASGGTDRLCFINSMVFSPDGQSLLYTGSSLPPQDGVESFTTFGKLPLSGGAPDNRAINAIQEKVMASQIGNAVFLPDGFLIEEDSRYKDGRLLFVDAASLSDSALALSSPQEGDVVCASENGSYIATIDDTATEGSFTIRVYSRDGGKAALLNERVINVSEYTYAPNLLLLEDSRLCVAIIGNRQEELKTRIEVWTF